MDHIRPWRKICRRQSRKIKVGSVEVGGGSLISVQSMTNTPTEDVSATIGQIRELELAGADIVRISCPTEDSTAALKEIVRSVEVPIVADIHFHYRRALEAADAGAACLRINPGNIGSRARVAEIVKAARMQGCSIRIGVNGGSLERSILEKHGRPCPEAMLESALHHASFLDDEGFHDYKISVKASDVFLTVASYRLLAEATEAPLHLGITEAGSFRSGAVKSSIGMGMLLWSGIGDTIRVSLSSDPVEEVRVGFDMLRALDLRSSGVNIISCPSCSRQGFDVIAVVGQLEERLAHIREPVTVSVIGCVVNGPGEASFADVGFTGGGKDAGMMYVSGRQFGKVSNSEIVDDIVEQVELRAARMREDGIQEVMKRTALV